MIVNVNPYDTGYDENSHVMKFSALAREIYTTPAAAPIQRVPSPTKPSTASKKAALSASKNPRESEPIPHRRKVTVSMGGAGKKFSEAHLEVVEGSYLATSTPCHC
jgi:kinesin family member 20